MEEENIKVTFECNKQTWENWVNCWRFLSFCEDEDFTVKEDFEQTAKDMIEFELDAKIETNWSQNPLYHELWQHDSKIGQEIRKKIFKLNW